jgi:geranylgeranyl pyrophosphate synthase
MQPAELYPALAGLLAQVEGEIHGVWSSAPGFVGAAAQKVLSGRGKRLRPVVALLAAECAGAAGRRSVALAAAVEIIHTASLVHDDVVDEALSRRGRRSAKALWGNKVSILLGDYLVARAFGILAEEDRGRLAPQMAEVAQRMCEGQILEVRSAGRLLPERRYTDIVRAKTGALFGWCGEAGVTTADGSPELAQALRHFGEEFGLAFQFADDILDLMGTNGRSGKPQGRDLAERKCTLPLIVAAHRGGGLRAQLGELLAAGPVSRRRLHAAREAVVAANALEPCWARVNDSLARARAALTAAPAGEAKAALFALAGEHFPLPLMSA